MKVLAKEIEMLFWSDKKGNLKPIRFRIENEDSTLSTIVIDKVITVDKEKLAGNLMLVYKCQSVIKGQERLYILKYEISTCRWILWKL